MIILLKFSYVRLVAFSFACCFCEAVKLIIGSDSENFRTFFFTTFTRQPCIILFTAAIQTSLKNIAKIFLKTPTKPININKYNKLIFTPTSSTTSFQID